MVGMVHIRNNMNRMARSYEGRNGDDMGHSYSLQKG